MALHQRRQLLLAVIAITSPALALAEPPDFGDLVRLRLLPLADLPAAAPAEGRP